MKAGHFMNTNDMLLKPSSDPAPCRRLAEALADRIVVMSEGRVVFETTAAAADRQVLGAHMGGGAHAGETIEPEKEAA